ncbi:hypothetical protein NEOLEDRAFT_1067731, partial [Neolentinus lepideus HHB14362 ss-1]
VLLLLSYLLTAPRRSQEKRHIRKGKVFQKLPKAEAKGRVRMFNLQSAKDCASVRTSLATVHARAQEMGNKTWLTHIYIREGRSAHGPALKV